MFSFQVTLSSVAVLSNDLYSIASSAECSGSLGRRLRATFVDTAGGPLISIENALQVPRRLHCIECPFLDACFLQS